MNTPIQNEQHALAEQVYISEFYINRASKLAHMRIQSWKMAITTPGIAKEYISEVKQYIEQSFFSLVPNSFILSEEGFYFTHMNN